MTEVQPLLVRAEQVAAMLAISKRSVWYYAKHGKIPAPIKWQGVTVWRVKDLEKIVDGLQT